MLLNILSTEKNGDCTLVGRVQLLTIRAKSTQDKDCEQEFEMLQENHTYGTYHISYGK